MYKFLRILVLVVSALSILSNIAYWVWIINRRYEMNIILANGQRWPVVTPISILFSILFILISLLLMYKFRVP